MSGGRLEIETLPAGAVVPAFEVLDAVSRGVIDGGHAWASYWAGKSKAAVLFTGGPGGTFGMDFTDYLGWMFEGGGLELYNEFYQKELKLKVVPYPIMFAGTPVAWLVQETHQELGRLQGRQVPRRGNGRRGFFEGRSERGQHTRWRDPARG